MDTKERKLDTVAGRLCVYENTAIARITVETDLEGIGADGKLIAQADMPTTFDELVHIIASAYKRGLDHGQAQGHAQIQYQMRKLLGMKE